MQAVEKKRAVLQKPKSTRSKNLPQSKQRTLWGEVKGYKWEKKERAKRKSLV